ncbi:hypothetical protein BKP45_06850 [Anaerobacillus alkalidiazotrophicus]|uniref:Uncharacterized protein n=1 Tax=Anaerobacillus alkalidiazotrophicus TaxID=472963 RepID=A0A1S2MCF5_9BACI|nr:hypothetical protein [Anaerobacillus alkalidiazotrophicus]OIJ22349.1 hypothetical protein BKP45_06850 [Anaerobacillus alkalidiazotrophicus]
MMNKSLSLRFGIVGLVVIVMAVSAYNHYLRSDSSSLVDKGDEKEVVEDVENVEIDEVPTEPVATPIDNANEKELHNKIFQLHTELNNTVGWRGYLSVNWDDEGRMNYLIEQTFLIEKGTSSEVLKQDMVNMRACLEVAYEKKDVYGLRLAHRIIHDLDYFINNNSTDGIVYNMTSYGNDSKINEVFTYIQ